MNVTKYFGVFPNVDVLHVTSDNIVFENKKKAEQHQSTLKKGELKTVCRKQKN